MRGKKTDYDTIYDIMTSWFTTHNYEETARQLNMPSATVKDIVKANMDKEEFLELRRQKENEFSDKASEIIDKGLMLLKRRMDRAIEEEETLDELIEEIWSMDDKEMSQQTKTATVNKIKNMQLHNLKDITTAIGTLYDKRALSKGEMTQNVGFATNFVLDKMLEISGYTKKADDSE